MKKLICITMLAFCTIINSFGMQAAAAYMGEKALASSGNQALLSDVVEVSSFVSFFDQFKAGQDDVTSGEGPRPTWITINNGTAYNLVFDGYRISNGKVIGEHPAPNIIKPGNSQSFKVSGRCWAFKGPFGAVKYKIHEIDNAVLVFSWGYCYNAGNGQAGKVTLVSTSDQGIEAHANASSSELTFDLRSY